MFRLSLIACALFITCIALWTVSAAAWNPVVQAQTVFLAHRGLLCFDLASMRTCWRRPDRIAGEPVLAGDTLLIGNSSGLFAFSTSTGELRWHQPSQSRLFAPSINPSIDDSVAYVGSEDGTLQAFSVADGTLRWQRKFDGWVYAPAIAKQQLIVTGQEPLVRALDPADGVTLWEYPLEQEAVHYPVLSADNVIVTDFSGAVLALDAASGELRWRLRDSSANHSPLAAGNTLYFRTFAGPIVARDAQDGREIWRSAQALSSQPLALSGDALLAVDEYDAVLVLDSASGAVLRRYPGRGTLIGAPVYADGRLIVFREAGGLRQAPQLTVISWTTTEEKAL